MNVNITARHFDLTESIKIHVENALSTIEKYNLDIISANAVITEEQHKAKVFVVEFTINVARHDTFVIKKDDKDAHAAIDKAIDITKKKGGKVFAAPSMSILSHNRKWAKILISKSDVISLNKEEARLLTKEKDLLKGLLKLGPKTLVITDKNKKIFAYDGKKKYSLIPHKIRVVERTGAGDAFASGFVAGLIAGKTIKESLKLGLRKRECY